MKNINSKAKHNWCVGRRMSSHCRDTRILTKAQTKKKKLLSYKGRNNLNIVPYKAKICRMRKGILADLMYMLLNN